MDTYMPMNQNYGWWQSESTLLERIAKEDWVGEQLTNRTKETYARRMVGIRKKIAESGYDGGICSPASLIEYFTKLIAAKEISNSTARSLKAAAIFWLLEEAQNAISGGESIHQYEKAYQCLRALSTKSLLDKTEKTSSSKAKHFPKDIYDGILKYLSLNRSNKCSQTLIAFLNANLLVGLRPSEWLHSSFISYLHYNDKGERLFSSIALAVENAKTTHGRGNGEYRVILLHEISDNDLAQLMHFKEIVTNHLCKYPADTSIELLTETFFKPLRKKLSVIINEMRLPQTARPTLYSTRHQAIADAKYSGLSEIEIAAMFGHRSVLTAKKHYGNKANGYRKTMFRPSPESIAAVNLQYPDNSLNPNAKVTTLAKDWVNHIEIKS